LARKKRRLSINTRVESRPDLIAWEGERSGIGLEVLADRFPKLPDWLNGSVRPTLKQLEDFAKATRAPLGYFFLPIPDFRTLGAARLGRPSPDLLETIYICPQRQEWYRGRALADGEGTLFFVGSASLESDVENVAATMRTNLGLDLEERR
jgi:hypothetical protein